MKHIAVIRREKTGLGHNNAATLIKKAIDMTLSAEGIEELCAVNVLLTDDEGIHAVNIEQRGIDSATDVLSFPLNELYPGAFDSDECEYDYDLEAIALGDMVISIERCDKQGEEFGHGFEREIMYLTVHSVLHLLGYDHLDEGEQKMLMRSREKAIMGDD